MRALPDRVLALDINPQRTERGCTGGQPCEAQCPTVPAMFRFLALTLVALVACADPAPAVVGRPSVVDGDTLEIQDQRIRLWGVDAPESRQICTRPSGAYRCGQVAASQLDQWIAGRPVRCVEDSRDRYGRMVTRCEFEGDDIGGWLVRRGHAVRYPEYAGSAYMIEELAARRERAGIWSGAFDYPWDWRRAQRRSR